MKAEKIAPLLEAAGTLVGEMQWGQGGAGSPRALRTETCQSRRRAEPPVGQWKISAAASKQRGGRDPAIRLPLPVPAHSGVSRNSLL